MRRRAGRGAGELALHPVAAPLFRLVERLIGPGEGLDNRFARLVLRDPDRYRQRTDRTRSWNGERADPLAQPLGIGHRARQRRVSQNLDELLAAIAPKDIGYAQSVLHGLRESPQDLIASQVVELVVVALEEIKVDDAN